MTTPTSVDSDLVEMMDAVFAGHRDQLGAERPNATWDPALWNQLGELGLVRLTGSEQSGGSGAGWLEAAELVRAAAQHGVQIPLAEHDLLSCWLLESAGLPIDDARRTVCVLENDVAHNVPWASEADKIVVVWKDAGAHFIADVDAATLTITAGMNVAGEPRDTVTVTPGTLNGTAVADSVVDLLFLRGALVRSLQVCAVLDQILALSVEHAGDRTQFGRPLAKFQAVQNLVADIASEAALARAATEAALTEAVRTDWAGTNLEFLVAVARSCAGHAASVVVRNAHQVHGAIGTTREHRLHEFTQPALAWRSEFGSVHYWDERLTAAAIAAGRDGLWSLITA
ncbi:acyl-CoA dehydrogenase family protein [Mycolicibacterium parafortuitum]|uniref:Acyl-CoA dehydrogenase [Rhodococcus jostii RHA1] n=1 Tax=Mycolicibacterium parafortuitum TaxID=39692 RepID=A0A375YGC0_MYCPF|nr:acyl-CoA dehydrogenase family protein [Mycolicibacterium parafortuitum]ORB28057.1 acyl-CoA dehydrogenase [Mycolicibacterium parafortuitum]SRX80161.1 acyl-CoA dehydrogenase [Rhodococcus jostii RHA1] [Mycolicibacterium parafortuitum]